MKHCVLGTGLVSEVREREGGRDGEMDGWIGEWEGGWVEGGGRERGWVKTYSHGLQKPRG